MSHNIDFVGVVSSKWNLVRGARIGVKRRLNCAPAGSVVPFVTTVRRRAGLPNRQCNHYIARAAAAVTSYSNVQREQSEAPMELPTVEHRTPCALIDTRTPWCSRCLQRRWALGVAANNATFLPHLLAVVPVRLTPDDWVMIGTTQSSVAGGSQSYGRWLRRLTWTVWYDWARFGPSGLGRTRPVRPGRPNRSSCGSALHGPAVMQSHAFLPYLFREYATFPRYLFAVVPVRPAAATASRPPHPLPPARLARVTLLAPAGDRANGCGPWQVRDHVSRIESWIRVVQETESESSGRPNPSRP
jgi:hypothetical protein